MGEDLERLRESVRAWYREEAERVAAAFAEESDLDKLDFDELQRRAQVLFACELAGLAEAEEEVRLEPGSPDHAQLERVAQAMLARGVEVPDSIRKALGKD
ncbi:MAG: hypothetical protein OEM59_06745 [Rhodospirillales bacterium]|nr:hypothetical protein [Rhodospirillales bacterium]